jgi:Histidine kinase
VPCSTGWNESVAVAVAVAAVEAATSVAQSASAAVTARRIVLWALLTAVILLAAHGLRDQIARSLASRLQLQERLGELTLIQDRDRIAASMHDQVISRLFAAGMTVQGAAAMTTDPENRRRLQHSVSEPDEAIALLRNAIFGLSARYQEPAGLRQQMLNLCQALDPQPEVEFAGPIDSGLTAEAQERLLVLLREAMTLLGADGVVTFVSAVADRNRLAIRLTARMPAEAAAEIGYLRQRAQAAGGDLDAIPAPGALELIWQFPADVTDAADADGEAASRPLPHRGRRAPDRLGHEH